MLLYVALAPIFEGIKPKKRLVLTRQKKRLSVCCMGERGSVGSDQRVPSCTIGNSAATALLASSLLMWLVRDMSGGKLESLLTDGGGDAQRLFFLL